MIRSDGTPLTDVAAVSRSEPGEADRSAQAAQALTPAQFISKIRAAAHAPHLVLHQIR
jgi:hypothetical protein